MVARKHSCKRITEQRIRPLALESAVMSHPECGVGDVFDEGSSHGRRMPFVRDLQLAEQGDGNGPLPPRQIGAPARRQRLA